VRRLHSRLSTLRMVKDAQEIDRIRAAAKVAAIGMGAAVQAVRPGVTRARWPARLSLPCARPGRRVLAIVCLLRPRTNIATPADDAQDRAERPGDDRHHPIVNGYSADICRTVCRERQPRAAGRLRCVSRSPAEHNQDDQGGVAWSIWKGTCTR